MPLGPGEHFGGYEILESLGAGGMGEVYRALDSNLGRQVAIKILPDAVAHDPDRLARFDREARLLASLNHPHIGAIYGREQSGATTGLVLELVEGETLAERLGRPLPVHEVRALTRQIVDAVEAAHDRGIVHRDLKPANIQVTPAGTIKVLDFGLAKMVHTDAAGADGSETTVVAKAPGHTERGVILGTTAYMSPEQARGLAVDRRTDIWAFGCILYEMLAGRRAFDGATMSDTIAAVLDREPDWSALPASTPRAMRRVMGRCLMKDPAQRLRDIADARFDLESDPEPDTVTATHTTRQPLAVAAMLGVALGAAALSLWPRATPTPSREPTTFVIPPPSGAQWSDTPTDPQPAVAPNGRLVAYNGIGADGTRLWIHDIQSGVATPVAGVSFSAAVAWSPDSTSLAYCASGTLIRVNLVGEAPAPLDAPGCSSRVSWNANGEILYSTRKGVMRTNVAGGVPQPVALDDAASSLRLYPRWLPDGRHFVYLRLDPDVTLNGIYLAAVDDGPPVRLVADASAPVPVEGPDGRVRVLFVRRASLVSQVVDVAARRVEGEAQVLATRVPLGNTVRIGAYDASGTLLAYRRRAEGQQTELVWLDRRGQRLGVVEIEDPLQVSLSPDEAILAVQRANVDQNTFELWQGDAKRGGGRPLVVSSHSVVTPVFSPDSAEIAYLSNETGSWRVARLTLGRDGALIPNEITLTFLTDWSSDGRWIVGSFGADRLLAVAPNGHESLNLGRGAEARLSPDRRWVAYRSSESGTAEIYVKAFPDGGRVMRISRSSGYKPTWRRDGRELYYRTASGTVMAVPVGVGAGAALDPGEPVPLFTAPFVPGNAPLGLIDYAVTHDGQRFLAVLAKSTTTDPLTIVRHWIP